MNRSDDVTRSAEALGVAIVGAAAAFVAGSLVTTWLAITLAAVAALNGLISGARGIYAWRRARGWLAFVLDSTWASLPVSLGLLAHVVAGVRDGGFEPSLSRRQNRHVYRRGAHLQSGYVFTIGNVVSSAGDVDQPRHRKLITDHEDVHVWQARWFGPMYPVLYIGWSIGGSLLGVVTWLRRGRREPLAEVVRSCSYYMNPFEWWAYCRDDLWPPSGLVRGVGWRRRVAKPLTEVPRHAAARGEQVDDVRRPGARASRPPG